MAQEETDQASADYDLSFGASQPSDDSLLCYINTFAFRSWLEFPNKTLWCRTPLSNAESDWTHGSLGANIFSQLLRLYQRDLSAPLSMWDRLYIQCKKTADPRKIYQSLISQAITKTIENNSGLCRATGAREFFSHQRPHAASLEPISHVLRTFHNSGKMIAWN